METISPHVLPPGFWCYLGLVCRMTCDMRKFQGFFKGKKLLPAEGGSVMWGGCLNAIMNSFFFLGDTEKPEIIFGRGE